MKEAKLIKSYEKAFSYIVNEVENKLTEKNLECLDLDYFKKTNQILTQKFRNELVSDFNYLIDFVIDIHKINFTKNKNNKNNNAVFSFVNNNLLIHLDGENQNLYFKYNSIEKTLKMMSSNTLFYTENKEKNCLQLDFKKINSVIKKHMFRHFIEENELKNKVFDILDQVYQIYETISKNNIQNECSFLIGKQYTEENNQKIKMLNKVRRIKIKPS